MSKDKWQGQDQFLLKNILEDDSPQAVKQQISDKRLFAFSAPPALFDFGYKTGAEELDNWDFDDPESSFTFPNKDKIKKEGPSKIQLFSPQVIPLKLEPQLEDPKLQIFTNASTPGSFYGSSTSDNDEIMNNLGHVCQMAREQNGSRTVQNIIEGNDEKEKEVVFSLVFLEAHELMKDRFGNYVFQKLFEKGQPKQKALLIDLMRGRFVQFSEHPYGCRVVQKAIESMAADLCNQQLFIKEIEPDSLRLIENQNGNHVIQKCFEVFPIEKMDEVVKKLYQEISHLAFHPYGCRVIQKYLENSEPHQPAKAVLQKLLVLAIDLSKCQYGNYVMQHIVSHCQAEQKQVLDIFYDNFVELSSNKYASNVVEKAIQHSPQDFKDNLGLKLSKLHPRDLVFLSKHQFGNYVIQSLYSKLSKEVKAVMKTKLRENHADICKSQFGRHVLMQLDKK